MAAGLTRRGLAALDESARTFGAHHLPQRRGEAELHHRPGVAGPAIPAARCAAARAARSRFRKSKAPALRVRAEALVLGAEVRLGRTAGAPLVAPTP